MIKVNLSEATKKTEKQNLHHLQTERSAAAITYMNIMKQSAPVISVEDNAIVLDGNLLCVKILCYLPH
jgi:hypothetical protein